MVLIRDPNERSSEKENDQPTVGSQENHNKGHESPAQANQNESGNSNNAGNDNPDILLKMLIQAAKKLWDQLKSTSNFIMVDLGGYQLVDRIVKWCVQHPQMAICLLAAGLVTFLPFLLLMGFALSTVLMTLTGFLVLEGTLLTILSMMLFGLLGALVIVLLFFAVVAVATYFGFVRIYDLYGNGESHKNALRNFLQRDIVRSSEHVNITNQTANSRDERIN